MKTLLQTKIMKSVSMNTLKGLLCLCLFGVTTSTLAINVTQETDIKTEPECPGCSGELQTAIDPATMSANANSGEGCDTCVVTTTITTWTYNSTTGELHSEDTRVLLGTVSSPTFLPALGGGAKIEALGGKVGRQSDRGWGRSVGFGSQRVMNYMSKVHLTSDKRFVRHYSAETQGLVVLEQDAQNPLLYNLVDNQACVRPGTSLLFTDADSDGQPESAVFTSPDSSTQTYSFETFSPTEELAGMVFQMTEKTTRDGHSVSIAYNANDVTITDASGQAYVCAVDGSDRITSISVGGATKTYTYENNDLKVTEVDSRNGLTLVTELDSTGRVISSGWTGGDQTQFSETYTYDSAGNITQKTVNGVPVSVSTTKNGGATTMTLTANGMTQTRTYGPFGITKIVDGLGNTVEKTYDTYGNLTSHKDQQGKITTYDYYSDGTLWKETDADGVVKEYTYDGNENLLTSKQHGLTTSYEYDSSNRLIKITRPTGEVTHIVRYTTNGLPKFRTTNIGDVSTPVWQCVYMEYNASGQATLKSRPYSVTDPLNPTMPTENPIIGMRYQYDSWGNRTHTTNEMNETVEMTYNGFNKVVTQKDQRGVTVKTYEYDDLGRKTKATDVDGANTNWYYDSRGYVYLIDGDIPGGGGGGCGCSGASTCGAKLGWYFYDDNGQLIKYTDLRYQDSTYGQSPTATPLDLTQDTGLNDRFSTYYFYDNAGRKVKERDCLGYETTFEYFADGAIKKVTPPVGPLASYTYTDANRTKTVTRGDETTTYGYDTHGRQTTVTDAAGGVNTTAYSSSTGLVSSTTDVLSNSTSYTYNANGAVKTVTSPNGTVSTSIYDIESQVVQTTNASNGETRTTTFEYDDAGRRTKTTIEPAGLNLVTTFTYGDARGLLTKTTSPEGIESTYGYDGHARQTTTTSGGVTRTTSYYVGTNWVHTTSDGLTTTEFHYDSVGNRISTKVTGRGQTDYTYDDGGRLYKTVMSGEDTGSTTRYQCTYRSLDAVGRVVWETTLYDNPAADPATQPKTSYTYWDTKMGQVKTVTNPENEVTSYTYAINSGTGRTNTVTPPDSVVLTTVYDLAGRVTSTTGGPSGDRTYTYYTSGLGNAQLWKVTDALGKYKENIYTSFGQLDIVKDELQQPTSYGYDVIGRRTTITDANTNVTTYAYNKDSQLTSTAYANGDTETLKYDNAADRGAGSGGTGRLWKKIKPDTSEIGYSYQADGAIAGVGPVSYSVSRNDDTVGSPGVGMTRTISGAGPAITETYDRFGRMSKVQDSVNGDITYAYDARGQRATMTPSHASVLAQTYTYDDAGRLKTVTEGSNTRATYTYTSGRRSDLDLGNGVGTDYTYNTTNGQLNSLVTSSTPAGTFSSFTYTRNGIGMPTHVVYADSSTADYTYDGAHRLASEIRKDSSGELIFSQAHTYDNVGNRIRVISKGVYPYRTDLDTIGLWHLDGNDEDSSGNENDGNTVSDGVWVPGVQDDAFEADPTRSAIVVPHDASMDLENGDFTVEAHINPDAYAGIIVGKYHDTTGEGWKLYLDANGKVVFEKSDGTTVTNWTSTTAIATASWAHVAVAFDVSASELKFYIDTTLDATHTGVTAAAIDTVADLQIGAGFDGGIDEVRLSKADRGSELLTTDVTFVYNNANQVIEDYATGTQLSSERNTYTYDANGNQTQVLTAIGGVPDTAGTPSFSWDFDNSQVPGATTYGNPTFTETATDTILDFDGTDDYFQKDVDVAFASGGTYSISMWIRTTGTTQMALFSAKAAAGHGVYVEVQPNGSIRFLHRYPLSSSGGTNCYSSSGYNDGEWHHIVGVKTSTDMTLYVDGEVAATASDTTTIPDALEVSVGRLHSGAPRLFNGQLADIRVYDSALDSTKVFEVKQSRPLMFSKKEMVYDIFNRQTSWTMSVVSGDSWAVDKSESSAYRGDKWHRTSSTSGGVTTNYLYDGDNILADIVGGSVVKSYVTPTLDSPASITDHSSSTTYYFNQDERQSVRNLTNSTGAIAQSYDYTAYGDEVDALTSGSVEQRYTYTGRELNDVSGDYYFRYRIYGARLGGFLSRDPLGYEQIIGSTYYIGSQTGVRPRSRFLGMGLYHGYFSSFLMRDPKGLAWWDDWGDFEDGFIMGGGLTNPVEDIVNLLITGKEDPTNEELAAALGEIDERLGGSDYGVTSGALTGFGIVTVNCCNEKNEKIRALFRKSGYGFFVGFSASAHVLANINGEGCPDNYQGWFYEIGISTPIPFVGIDYEHGIPTDPIRSVPPLEYGPHPRPAPVQGGGGGFGIMVNLGSWFFYEKFDEQVIGDCCEDK